MILYHAAPIALGPGSVILPGNWGRLIRAVGERHDFHVRETIFEEVRSQFYPAKPSRMAACFACLDLPTLQRYMSTNSPYAVAHEVELADGGVALHATDWTIPPPKGAEPDAIRRAAERYWNPAGDLAVGNFHPEVLSASAFKVIRAL